jgi:hypothetical protein
MRQLKNVGHVARHLTCPLQTDQGHHSLTTKKRGDSFDSKRLKNLSFYSFSTKMSPLLCCIIYGDPD